MQQHPWVQISGVQTLGRAQVTLPSPSVLNSLFLFFSSPNFFWNLLFFNQWGRGFDDSSSFFPICLAAFHRAAAALWWLALCSCCRSRTDVALIAPTGRKGGGYVCYSEHFLGGYALETTTIAHSSHTVWTIHSVDILSRGYEGEAGSSL